MNDDLIARAEAALQEVDSGYRSAAFPLRDLLSDLIARVRELEEALRVGEAVRWLRSAGWHPLEDCPTALLLGAANTRADQANVRANRAEEALRAHRQVKAPSWSTKIHCACGEQFVSRCEHALHAERARAALREDEG